MKNARLVVGVALLSLVGAVPSLSTSRAPRSPGMKSLELLPMDARLLRRLSPTSGQVETARSADPTAPGVVVAIQPGAESYPGVRVRPEGAAWNLTAFGHIDARIANLGASPVSAALRVDNAGDWHVNPWDTESIELKPGETGVVRVIFGYSYGHKPGYRLKPGAIVGILLFVTKRTDVQSFRIESLAAGGTPGEQPPVDPASVRVKPRNGYLLGGGARLGSATRVTTEGAHASPVSTVAGPSLKVEYPAAGGGLVSLLPAVGRWDLRDSAEVRATVRNAGDLPASPRIRIESNGGATAWLGLAAPLAKGASRVITVPFAPSAPIKLGSPGSAGRFTSDAVSSIDLSVKGTGRPQVLEVTSIRADLPHATLPAWLGKRPPAPGAWVKTLDDEFNGRALNTRIWSVYGDNYWDKTSHWSKKDVILGGGLVRLRYEKKRGFNNDDPTQKATDYAAGYLHTYGKWTQRYGYFEARMKLPTAPGLWPAFWMMPDRGPKAGPQWKRQDTGSGGMEFDIMEHLTRWGPDRYNIAMHYDGYGADHKSVGSDSVYVEPDRDGFITCGLLWTPGSAIYYCNGREVLSWQNPRISSVPSILMFTLPMGGWDNDSLDDNRLPADFVIDYVRVWQRRDLASPPPLAAR